MSHFVPINCKTHYSLQKGFCRNNLLAKKCAEYGYKACGIADIKTLSGAVDFHQQCKKHGVKPLIGCDFDDYILFAKNKEGWFDLIKYVSDQTLEVLKIVAQKKNIICVSKKSNGFKKLFKNNHFQYNYSKNSVYYVTEDEVDCHRILLCSGMKTTMKKVAKLLNQKEEIDNKEFFQKSSFYLPTPKDTGDSDYSLLNEIADMCEEYEVAEKPMLPTFDCPEGVDEDEYLTQLCRVGWKEKLMDSGKVDKEDIKNEYAERVKSELRVIIKAELSGYFLIVQDIINFVKDRGWLAGPGRGSAAGCLVSYLMGITEVDPIEYGLIFERFYNEGRNTEDHVSLPDIDMDVPAEYRDDVIDYIKKKYGEENVAQMITFGRLQGRAAVKEVLRINEAVSFSEMNAITESIPDEARISDQLELMEEKSIIKWTLENEPENLKNWCIMQDDGTLTGPLANLFEQAIKIEGTNKSQGKHPAGVIISKNRLADVCPMTTDKSGDPVASLDMGDLETLGHVKFDVLGIDLLSKIMEIVKND
tara:strand:- start:624 stop:2216 length:1593 start_codon:yes stop_codon:yes gene_type:complete